MPGLVINTTTYVKYKITPLEDIASKVNQILSEKVFPVFKCQMSYLAKFGKNGKEMFKRWIKSIMIEFYRTRDISASTYIKLPKKYKKLKINS